MLKIDRSLAGNIDFAVVKFRGSAKKSRKMSLVTLQNVKIGGRLARNARFGALACLVSGHWFSGSFAVSTGEVAKHVLSARNCANWRRSRTKCSFWCSHVSCFASLVPCGFAVSMGEAAKPLLFEGSHAGCHVVLRGRRGTL